MDTRRYIITIGGGFYVLNFGRTYRAARVRGVIRETPERAKAIAAAFNGELTEL